MASPSMITPTSTRSLSAVASNIYTTPVSRKNIEKQDQESPFVLDYDGVAGGAMAEVKTARRNEHLSCAIVWSPLPLITWLIPFIGHTGICDSSGIASDFRGPYFVGDDGRMAFGAPTRFLKIDIAASGISVERWDSSIQHANEVYRGRMHNICCDNCHSHVACALNHMPVTAYGVQKWDMVKIACLIFFRADFLSCSAIVQQFLPLTIMLALVVGFKVW